MKVIQITAAYKPAHIYGGPTMSVAKLCEALVKRKEQGLKNKDIEELEVLTTTANGKEELNVIASERIQVDGVKVTYYKRLTKDHTHFSPALLWALRKQILRCAKNNKSLIVHIHAWWNLVSVLSCFVAKWYNIPVILSPRGMLTNYTTTNKNSFFKSLLHHLMGNRLLNYCHIHATSEKEKKDILSMAQPKTITVIPNLVELGKKEQGTRSKDQRLTASTESANETFKLIFLSRIEEKKGLELLFDALSELKTDWTLTLAGTGREDYVNDLKLKAESLSINSRLSWVGHVKNEDKFNLLAHHDLMALTSYNENFANVVIESLSEGTPVLLTEQVGLSDYILDKDLGWICELNRNSIIKNLNAAYLDTNKRNSIRAKGQQLIANDYSDGTLVEKYINLYHIVN